jgi:hypothetical protein
MRIGRTALDLEDFLPASLVPESDKSISSCRRYYIAGCIIRPLKARDLRVHIFYYAVWQHVQGLGIEEA